MNIKQFLNIINKNQWKIYFAIFLLGHIIIYNSIGGFSLDSTKSIISFIVLIMSTIGFYCFAWQKKYLLN